MGAIVTALRSANELADIPRLSQTPWVNDACRGAVSWVLQWLPDALAPFGLQGIFLAGSGAFEEAVGFEFEDSGRRLLLSDLDLGALVREQPDEATEAEIRARLAQPPAQPENAPWPELSLGLLTEADRARQDPTPGLVDLVFASCPLWGSPRTPTRFVAPAPEHLPRWEAWRLLGNRSKELLGAAIDGEERRVRAEHALAKLIFGAWTACLIDQGRYRPGLHARLRLLDQPDAGNAGHLAPASVVQATAAVREFLLSPSEANRPRQLGLGELHEVMRDTTARLLGASSFNSHGLAEAYLDQPSSVRQRLRQWRRQLRSDFGSWRLAAWAHGFGGTPMGRVLGLCTLYWCTLPEQPEPAWGYPSPGEHGVQSDSSERDAQEWENGARLLMPGLAASGPGTRTRLRRLLETIR